MLAVVDRRKQQPLPRRATRGESVEGQETLLLAYPVGPLFSQA